MWMVRKSKQIGVVTFWEVYKLMPTGDTVFRGKWTHRAEAEAVASRLNKEEAEKNADTV